MKRGGLKTKVLTLVCAVRELVVINNRFGRGVEFFCRFENHKRNSETSTRPDWTAPDWTGP